jgi:hypothetical protein
MFRAQPESNTVTCHHRNLAAIAAALAIGACAVPQSPSGGKSSTPAGITLSGPPYGDGPVELFIDGSDGSSCRWELKARYPTDTAPHSVDLRAEYLDAESGRVLAQSGVATSLPETDSGLSRMAGGLIETRLFNWEEPIPCSRVEAAITIASCLNGACPRYAAAKGRVPVKLVVGQN